MQLKLIYDSKKVVTFQLKDFVNYTLKELFETCFILIVMHSNVNLSSLPGGTIVTTKPAKTDINIWYSNVSFEISNTGNNVPVDDLKMIAAGNVSIIPINPLKLKECGL